MRFLIDAGSDCCVQSVKGMLENPTEAVNELSFFECIDGVMENSKVPHTALITQL